jgi:uncharacterized protein
MNIYKSSMHQAQSVGIKAVTEGDTISIILKLVGEVCNLDCVYCYEKRKPYAGNRVLSVADVKILLADLSDVPLRIELHGGEPLLYPKESMRELVDLFSQRKASTRICIQTNGTLLTLEWLQIFEPIREIFEIGLSMDGPGELNGWRLTNAGKASDNAVVSVLAMLEQQNIAVGVISVVNSKSVGLARDIIQYFSTYSNVRVLKFVPCFDFGVYQDIGPARAQHTVTAFSQSSGVRLPWAITPQQYAAFLVDAFNYWNSGCFHDRLVVEPFLGIAQSALEVQTSNCIFSETKCHHVMTVYPDGTVGSCDEFQRDDAAYGKLKTLGLALKNPTQLFRNGKLDAVANQLYDKCESCSYYSICKGGCIASRRRLSIVGRDDEYCDYRKLVIDHIVPTMIAAVRP